jgi:molybdenum cofactor cytidylyltransferase
MSSMPSARRLGVLLAAGRGRRMGRTKQLLPWQTREGTKPLVAAAYDAVCSICDEMIVVIGHDADAVSAALGDRRFHRAQSDPDVSMFRSIRAGLEVARRLDPSAAVVLQPTDHPEVARSTLTALIETSLKCPDQAIIPEFAGRGGHPILIPPAVISRLLVSESPAGLSDVWISYPEYCVRIAVDDASVCRDIDTPEDLV